MKYFHFSRRDVLRRRPLSLGTLDSCCQDVSLRRPVCEVSEGGEPMKSILIEWDKNRTKVTITPGVPTHEVLGMLRIATISSEEGLKGQIRRATKKESR